MRSRYLLPVMFLVVAALIAGCSREGTDLDLCPERRRRCRSPRSRRPAQRAHPPAPAAAAASGTLEITAFDLGFEPAQLTVPEPGSYEVQLTNTGSDPPRHHFPGRRGRPRPMAGRRRQSTSKSRPRVSRSSARSRATSRPA